MKDDDAYEILYSWPKKGGTFYNYLKRQREWSRRTFGFGPRTEGICKHIEKELAEIRKAPYSFEWLDVVILALDGMWRTGASLTDIQNALWEKQEENLRRSWPDPKELSQNEVSEHIKKEDKDEN